MSTEKKLIVMSPEKPLPFQTMQLQDDQMSLCICYMSAGKRGVSKRFFFLTEGKVGNIQLKYSS